MKIKSTHVLNKEETERATEWLAAHKKVCKVLWNGATLKKPSVTGGYISYIFKPNSAYTAVSIKCSCNNIEFSLTGSDYLNH